MKGRGYFIHHTQFVQGLATTKQLVDKSTRSLQKMTKCQ